MVCWSVVYTQSKTVEAEYFWVIDHIYSPSDLDQLCKWKYMYCPKNVKTDLYCSKSEGFIWKIRSYVFSIPVRISQKYKVFIWHQRYVTKTLFFHCAFWFQAEREKGGGEEPQGPGHCIAGELMEARHNSSQENNCRLTIIQPVCMRMPRFFLMDMCYNVVLQNCHVSKKSTL